MKKIILVLISLFILNVKADMGPPMIIEYEAVVTNKNGASCYSDGKKTSEIVPFGEVVKVMFEIDGKYVDASYGENKSCNLRASDIKAKTDSFSYKEDGVDKITSKKAIILAKGGLNMRKGPSIAYSKVVTIPQYSVVTLKYRAGTFWYYAEYNGKSGWISGMNEYFGMEGDEILYSYNSVDIYDMNNKNKKIGTIPPLTEITSYLELVQYTGPAYLVNYNGIKGYVLYMPNKVEGTLQLLKDAKLYQGKKIVKTLSKGEKFDFSNMDYSEMSETDTGFYLPDQKGYVILDTNDYKMINEPKKVEKTTMVIGKGLFGEKNTTKPDNNNEEQNEVIENRQEEVKEEVKEKTESKFNTKEIIIIVLLASILLALTALIIIKLVNMKKDKKVIEKVIEVEKN